MDEATKLRLRTFALTGQAINPASFPGFTEAELAREVIAIKSDPRAIQTRDYVPPATYAAKRIGDRSFGFVISSDNPDHGGDIIKQNGIDLSVYKANPVVLWAHDGRSRPPVGTGKNLKRNVKLPQGGRGTEAEVELAPEGTSDFTDALFRFVDAGIVRATSVGIKFVEVKDVTDKERERLGLGRFGLLINKSRLLEFSLVSIPQNPDALGKQCDEILTKGLAPKAGVEEMLRYFPMTERDQAQMIDELFKQYHHLGGIEPADDDADADGADVQGESPPDGGDGDKSHPAWMTGDGLDVDALAKEITDTVDRVVAAMMPEDDTEAADGAPTEGEEKSAQSAGESASEADEQPAPETRVDGQLVATFEAACDALRDATARAEQLESLLERIEQITVKQNEAIMSLGDLVEQLSRAERPDRESNADTSDITQLIADAFRAAVEQHTDRRKE